MPRINTSLTRLLGIRVPLVVPPMAGGSNARLVAQVTHGGGFGFIPAGLDSADKLRSEISFIRTSFPHSGDSLPVGVGYLGWTLEDPQNPSALELLDVALSSRVQAVWFACGTQLGRWVRHVREFDARADADAAHTTRVFVQVGTYEEALQAIHEWKVDVLVVQGRESGGHGHSAAPSTFALASAVLRVLPKDGPLLIGAGGLANGAQAAALLTLGAAGAAFGTRFLLTPESSYTDAQKAALLAAGAGSTVRTLVFDRVRGTVGWPQGIDGRALWNETVKDADAGVDFEEVKRRFATGDSSRMVVWAGEGVALMDEIKGAKDLVEDLNSEIIEGLQAAQKLLE